MRLQSPCANSSVMTCLLGLGDFEAQVNTAQELHAMALYDPGKVASPTERLHLLPLCANLNYSLGGMFF